MDQKILMEKIEELLKNKNELITIFKENGLINSDEINITEKLKRISEQLEPIRNKISKNEDDIRGLLN